MIPTNVTGRGTTFCAIEDVRCPSCSRPLVLRSGPAITPHFAHRPRQSCRKRPGRTAPVRPLNLEQLTLFELELELELELEREREPIPAFYWEPAPMEPPAPRPRRRRRAWLPRLLRWAKAKAARFSPAG